ncbi:MAG: protein kinase [bacterium]
MSWTTPVRPGDVLASRYELVRELGSGAMGIVYLAYDRERRGPVAVKTLRSVEPATLLRLKSEFRELAGIVHPNLVRLHELACADGEWWIAMELVAGVAFTEHVRADAVQRAARGAGASPADPDRLRAVLPQLVEAVGALHAAEKIHRDVKPANVLVTPAGRVVLLDFGLVTALTPAALRHESHAGVLGTPAYMAPELFAGGAQTPACDWYSVGALLFEALAGSPPFAGDWVEILLAKQRHALLRPADLVRDVPPDLDELCARLLARDPQLRPSFSELCERVAFPSGRARAATSAARGTRSLVNRVRPFVGREREAAWLAQGWSRVHERDAPVVRFIRGESGIGKSALAGELVRRLGEDVPELVALRGRCHERESVPFKAVDPIVDELVRHLASHPDPLAERVATADLEALARAFPVLRRMSALATAAPGALATAEPQELRRRAAVALRELLARLAAERPVVVWIDDLQWSDVDGAALWVDVLSGGNPPALYWIGCQRPDETGHPGLAALRARLTPEAGIDAATLDLGVLPGEDATALARELLGARAASQDAAAVATQSAGQPFFLVTLASHLAERVESTPAAAGDGPACPSLDRLLAGRIERLPAGPRRLLAAIAVAGGPVSVASAAASAGLDSVAAEWLDLLEDERWTARRADQRGALDTEHDRVRGAVLALLDDEARRVLHGRLAEEWIADGSAEPGRIADHLRAAGRRGEAAQFLEAAARRAADALAFESAASLFRAALEVVSADRRPDLELELARALANAGRGAEAAETFLEASARPAAADPLGLRWEAAEQWIRAGHVDRGIAIAATLLRELGIPMPRSSRRALAGLVLERARLALEARLRGSERARGVDAAGVRRIDTCFSFAAAMGLVDPIVGALYQARHLRLARALDDDPVRRSRALALETAYRAALGETDPARIQESFGEAAALARASGEARASGFVTLLEGIAWHQRGEWARSRTLAAEAEATFRDGCTAVAWERVNARRLLLTNLYWEGDFVTLAALVPTILADAERRGDRYEALVVRGFFSVLVQLARGDLARASDDVAHAAAIVGSSQPRLYDTYRLLGACQLHLHRGAPADAARTIAGEWHGLVRAQTLRMTAARVLLADLRGRVALLSGGGTWLAWRGRGGAAREARVLAHPSLRWSRGLAELIEAGIAHGDGDAERAAVRYERAQTDFAARGMRAHAAAAAHRLGELTLGDRGEAARATARAELARLGIADPARWIAVVAPCPGGSLPADPPRPG